MRNPAVLCACYCSPYHIHGSPAIESSSCGFCSFLALSLSSHNLITFYMQRERDGMLSIVIIGFQRRPDFCLMRQSSSSSVKMVAEDALFCNSIVCIIVQCNLIKMAEFIRGFLRLQEVTRILLWSCGPCKNLVASYSKPCRALRNPGLFSSVATPPFHDCRALSTSLHHHHHHPV